MSNYPQFPQPPKPTAGGNPFADQAPNPYAAPQTTGYDPQPAGSTPFAGLWRQGDLLVMHKMAPLPSICLKSNQPATRRLKRNLIWHHPLVFLALLVNLIVYAVVAMIMQKRATIHIGLSEEWFAIRRQRIMIAWGIVLVSIVTFVGAIVLSDTLEDATIFICFGAFFLFLGGLIYGLVSARMVWPKRMTDTYIWLKGVHPDFLNRLEVWPYTNI
jgi:hypothetical protein